jgi:hypothetical protein
MSAASPVAAEPNGCVICLEPYDYDQGANSRRPMLLPPCLHSVCLKCLRIDLVKCPLCRSDITREQIKPNVELEHSLRQHSVNAQRMAEMARDAATERAQRISLQRQLDAANRIIASDREEYKVPEIGSHASRRPLPMQHAFMPSAARNLPHPLAQFESNLFQWEGSPKSWDYDHMYSWMVHLSEQLAPEVRHTMGPLLAALQKADITALSGSAPIAEEHENCRIQMERFTLYIMTLPPSEQKRLETKMLPYAIRDEDHRSLSPQHFGQPIPPALRAPIPPALAAPIPPALPAPMLPQRHRSFCEHLRDTASATATQVMEWRRTLSNTEILHLTAAATTGVLGGIVFGLPGVVTLGGISLSGFLLDRRASRN